MGLLGRTMTTLDVVIPPGGFILEQALEGSDNGAAWFLPIQRRRVLVVWCSAVLAEDFW
jgi:hypothetical protein